MGVLEKFIDLVKIDSPSDPASPTCPSTAMQLDVANHLHITEATLSVRIKRLVDSGLVEREVDRNDKRVYSIVLSKKGEKLMNDMENAIHHYQEVICKGITNEEYESVLKVIHKIQKNIKEEIE